MLESRNKCTVLLIKETKYLINGRKMVRCGLYKFTGLRVYKFTN